jgi:hypothetical protein
VNEHHKLLTVLSILKKQQKAITGAFVSVAEYTDDIIQLVTDQEINLVKPGP